MSKRNDRITVTLEAARGRFRWVTLDGKRPGQLIPNFRSLTADQVENLRIGWELMLNNGSVDPFTGLAVTTTMTMEQLWAHYKYSQLPNLSPDTQDCYCSDVAGVHRRSLGQGAARRCQDAACRAVAA